MMLGARTAAWAKTEVKDVIPVLTVNSNGILDCILNSKISTPYTVNMFVRQNINQSTSLSDSPMFFSCGGESTGSGIGRSGQTNDWNKYFSALNQPKYWCQFGGLNISNDYDWHFITFCVNSLYNPFSLYVDGVKTSSIYNRGHGYVGDTSAGAHFNFFCRTSNGISAEQGSQWRGSIARVSFFRRSFSDYDAEDSFKRRYERRTDAVNRWEGIIDNDIVADEVGDLNMNVIGSVISSFESIDV